MKKTIAILLSLTMILGLAACGNSASQTEQPPTEDTSAESKADTNSAENSTDMENTDNQDVQDHKVLVAYFSATGTTKGVAEHIANRFIYNKFNNIINGGNYYEQENFGGLFFSKRRNCKGSAETFGSGRRRPV